MNRYVYVIALSAICLGLVGRTAGQCLVGYIDPQNELPSCYKIAKTPVSWFEARELCANEGGSLASIGSDQEFAFLKRQVASTTQYYFHVGLQVIDTAAKIWGWLDGTPFDGSIVKFSNQLNFGEYAAMQPNGYFYKQTDRTRQFYICERSKYTSVQCDGTRGWKEASENTCIKFYDQQRLTFWDARSQCKRDNADLVVINSESTNNLVSSRLGTNTNTWIGLTTALNSELEADGNATWKWVNDQPLNYTSWNTPATAVVKVSDRNVTCAVAYSTGKWSTQKCSTTSDAVKYTCQRKSGECADGWTRSGSYCYLPSFKMTWPEANQDCTSRGANLAIFDSPEVQKYVESTLADFFANGQSHIWIGYSQTSSNAPYVPVISSSSAFTNWGPNQPKNGTIPYGCGRIATAAADKSWTSSTCADLNGFLCQAPAGRSLTVPRPITPAPRMNCELGWTQWNEKCYLMLNEEEKFENARGRCALYGSSLAVIDAIDYQAAVTRLTATRSTPAWWIGLKKLAPGDYIWVNEKSATSFQNFNDGADPTDPEKNCVMMYGGSLQNGGRWDFKSCDSALPVLCSKPPSLLATIPIPPTYLTGSPSTRCPSGWEEIANTNNCYFYMRYSSTWNNALQGCRTLGAELAYIASIDEMRIIASRIKNNGLGWWIGLNVQGTELKRFHWSNKNIPIAFTNWGAGEPAIAAGDCVVALSTTGTWKISKCDQVYNFICQRVADIPLPTKPPVVYSTPAGGSLVCSDDTWVQYGRNDYCYKFFDGPDSWSVASEKCKSAAPQSNLVSIGDVYEQDFVVLTIIQQALARNKNASDVWIGMSDKLDSTFQNMVEYVWSDNSKVTFTKWMPLQPSSSNQECVAIKVGRDGEWEDRNCGDYQLDGFVCKAPPIVSAATRTTTPPSGCIPPYTLAYEGKCYFINSQGSVSWDGAYAHCQSQQFGNLVVLATRQEQNFISVALAGNSALMSPHWIGLSGQNGAWYWVDNTQPSFTNWDADYSSPTTRTCVAMSDASSTAPGLWMLQECPEQLPYVCETKRQGWTRTQSMKTTSISNNACPSGWVNEQGSYRCYLPIDQPLGVSESIKYCETTYGATLASFSSMADMKTVAKRMADFNVDDAWIALSKRDEERGWQWMDGTPILFEQWDSDQPDQSDSTKTCAFMAYDSDRKDGFWVNDDCSNQHQFICMRIKGVALTTTKPRTTNGNATELCGAGWSLYNSYCYWTELSFQTTWPKALDFCTNMNGSLVSILSDDENKFVQKSASSKVPYLWTGLNELTFTGYTWSDNSPLVYENWAANAQPDNSPCVAMIVNNGRWMKQHCEVSYSFVCKKPIGGGSVFRPTTAPRILGGCPPDYISYGSSSKCYRIFNADAREQTEALKKCQPLGIGLAGNLASFNDIVDMNFVISKLRNVVSLTQTAYIGLLDYGSQVGKPQFRWMDNSAVTFTNWDIKEPAISSVTVPGSCVDMYVTGTSVGKWRAQTMCRTSQTYVCSVLKDSKFPAVADEPNKCKPQWMPYGEHCYFVGGRNTIDALSWEDARDACLRQDSQLVSIHDAYEQAALVWAVMSETVTTPINFWIGLNTYSAPDVWLWSDDWPVDYTAWLPQEPESNTMKRCGAGVIQSVFAKDAGRWGSLDCREKNAYVCRMTTAKPNVDTMIEGTCPTGWVAGGTKCYLVVSSKSKAVTWGDATIQCKAANAVFGTVETPTDNKLIAAALSRQYEINPDAATDVWLGISTQGGIITPLDSPVVSFTNWADKVQPSVYQAGVFMKPTSFWYTASPAVKLGYVCKLPKTPKATLPPADLNRTTAYVPVYTKGPVVYAHEATYDSGVGLIVGVCVGFVLLLCGFVGLLVYLKRKNMVPEKIDIIVTKSATLKSSAAQSQSTSSSAGGLIGFENVVFEAPKDAGASNNLGV